MLTFAKSWHGVRTVHEQEKDASLRTAETKSPVPVDTEGELRPLKMLRISALPLEKPFWSSTVGSAGKSPVLKFGVLGVRVGLEVASTCI